MHWRVTRRCYGGRYWTCVEVHSLEPALPGVAGCPSSMLKKEQSWPGLSRPESVSKVNPPTSLWLSFFTNKFSVVITPTFVVKMKCKSEEKCPLNCKVSCKILFIFFRVALDLTLVHFMQMLSEYYFSASLLRITCASNLCVDTPSNPRGLIQIARRADQSLVWPRAHWCSIGKCRLNSAVCSPFTWQHWVEIPTFGPTGCSPKCMVNRKKRLDYKSLEVSLLRKYLMREPQGKLNPLIDWERALQKLLNI